MACNIPIPSHSHQFIPIPKHIPTCYQNLFSVPPIHVWLMNDIILSLNNQTMINVRMQTRNYLGLKISTVQ